MLGSDAIAVASVSVHILYNNRGKDWLKVSAQGCIICMSAQLHACAF